ARSKLITVPIIPMRFMGPPNIWMRERLRVERGLRRILRKLQQGLRLASGNVRRLMREREECDSGAVVRPQSGLDRRGGSRRPRRMGASARAKISAAQKARWAKSKRPQRPLLAPQFRSRGEAGESLPAA